VRKHTLRGIGSTFAPASAVVNHTSVNAPKLPTNPPRRPRLQSEITNDRFELFMEQQATSNSARDQVISSLQSDFQHMIKAQDAIQKQMTQLNRSVLELISQDNPRSRRESTPGSASDSGSLVAQPGARTRAPNAADPAAYQVDRAAKVSLLHLR
jgi:hypothetical protein